MKKIFITCLLSISSLLAVQYFYIQLTPKSQLTHLIRTLKNKSIDLEQSKTGGNIDEKSLIKAVKIVGVKTGFYAGNLWYPSIIVEFKNDSEEDLKEYISSKAIFINSTTNEQIGVHTKYISTSRDFFLSGTTLRKQFKSDSGYRGSFSGLEIIVKFYLEDELIETYIIKKQQI